MSLSSKQNLGEVTGASMSSSVNGVGFESQPFERPSCGDSQHLAAFSEFPDRLIALNTVRFVFPLG